MKKKNRINGTQNQVPKILTITLVNFYCHVMLCLLLYLWGCSEYE